MKGQPTIKTARLLLMEIRMEHDVVLCRQRARQLAALLGFSSQEQIRMATALSEIARNAFEYAGGGKVEFSFESEPRSHTRPRQSFVVEVSDKGRGIAEIDKILGGSYHSKSGLGLGILGAKRLMDEMTVETSGAGTRVTLRQTLPMNSPILDFAQVQGLVDQMQRQRPASALEEMQLQNQELIRAIDNSRKREEEIQRINHELAETNSGVLALYDELETLHRVSVLLSSQLDLKALIQSIIDVTTDLTNADLGAFYFRSETGESWNLYATAGSARDTVSDQGQAFGLPAESDGFGSDGVIRINDVHEEIEAPEASLRAARRLGDILPVRACLVVPVNTANNDLSAAMIFCASEPGRFSERSERIVSSIAAQAVVGIEKSRLFHAVKASGEAKDQFLAMLSHELRTPLNPVLAIVSAWQGDPRVPEDMRDEVSTVVRNVRLEARLIDDLLDFNKLVNGKLEIDHQPVNMHGVIKAVIEICREDLETAGQQLEVSLAASDYAVSGDAARLQQILWNVLKNAIKFTPRKGVLKLRTFNPGKKTLRVEIEDSGLGIAPEALGRIFGAFEQGHPQVLAQFGGLGLGLAIARTFVERHGGKISASSEGVGRGATFIIDLPATEDAGGKQATSAVAPTKAVTSTPHSRILLVDDHPDTLLTLARLLTRRGYVVTTASSGEAARQQFQRSPFDLIVSDLGLPDCSGLDLLRELHAVRLVPAIALSGYGMETDVLGSQAAGFAKHLTKPVDFEQLLRAVETLTVND